MRNKDKVAVEIVMNFDERGRSYPYKIRYFDETRVTYISGPVKEIYYYKVDWKEELFSINFNDSNYILYKERGSNRWFLR